MIDIVRVAATMTGAQLKFSNVTGVALGQEHQKHAKPAYKKPTALIGVPYFPSENPVSGKGFGGDKR
jgi:hypothetical protein